MQYIRITVKVVVIQYKGIAYPFYYVHKLTCLSGMEQDRKTLGIRFNNRNNS